MSAGCNVVGLGGGLVKGSAPTIGPTLGPTCMILGRDIESTYQTEIFPKRALDRDDYLLKC